MTTFEVLNDAVNNGILRRKLKLAGGPMKDLTVLAAQHDPFRVDTHAGHRDGGWLAHQIDELGLTGPRHLRGLHYVLIGRPKPNGTPYTNTAADWDWLGVAAKSARWLGYVPFDRIVDQRNDEPVIREYKPCDPDPYVWLDFDVVIPDADGLRPLAGISGLTAEQPYHLVLVGEKSSLRPALTALADRFHADLYLPTGEISDTQAHRMAGSAFCDSRPLIVFYFSDSDPAGWQMPISLSRKLQALEALACPGLEWQVRRVGLTPEQVKEYGLPSTPLKDTEKRGELWTEMMGVEQTEIDALAALRPDLLTEIAADAISPFFDSGLEHRMYQARSEWLEEAQAALDQHGAGHLDVIRDDVAGKLAAKREEIQSLLEGVRVDPETLEGILPDPQIPEPEVHPELAGEPLCDSRWDFTTQCRRLKASKGYRI